MKLTLGGRSQQFPSGKEKKLMIISTMVFELQSAKQTFPVSLLSRNYVVMVTMFFTVSVINNYSLNFHIAMPLHMIFRSVRAAFPAFT